VEDNVKISILLEIYGKLLTEKQYTLLDDYYNNDLSLSEIAENQQITRQAVRDNLKKGENNLLDYEDKLGLMKKNVMQRKALNEVLDALKKIEVSEKSKTKVNQIENMITKLIN
jgi:hypothetical protein